MPAHSGWAMPPSDKTDLERRIAAAGPADKLRGFFFQHIVELVKQRISADAARRILASLRPEGYAALRNYPATELLRLMYAAVDELEPQMGVEAAFRACGAASLDAFAKSAAGRVLFGVVAFGNPARLGSQMELAFKTSVSFGKHEFHQTSPSGGIVQYRDDYLPPAYMEGVLFRAFEAIGHRVTVKRIEKTVSDVDFEITWEPLKK